MGSRLRSSESAECRRDPYMLRPLYALQKPAGQPGAPLNSNLRQMMKVEIEEVVLRYDSSDYTSWKQGDKECLSPDLAMDVLATIDHQPKNHFGESFVLAHFAKQGWKGFAFYAVGAWASDTRYEKWRPGQRIVEEIVPEKNLASFRKQRTKEDAGSGAGEPDLFLYKGCGEFMFAEVKLNNDSLGKAQEKCISQLLKYLQCPILIVKVLPVGKQYNKKTYTFDLTHV